MSEKSIILSSILCGPEPVRAVQPIGLITVPHGSPVGDPMQIYADRFSRHYRICCLAGCACYFDWIRPQLIVPRSAKLPDIGARA